MPYSATPTPVAEFSIKLSVNSNGSVCVRVTREMFAEGTDPKTVDEALGPAMEDLQDVLAREIGILKTEHSTRELLKR